MLCLECATRSPRPRVRQTHIGTTSEGARRLRSLVCAGCGSLLPLTDSADGLLCKLVQLDRFGLGAFAAPLLRHDRQLQLEVARAPSSVSTASAAETNS